MAEDHVAKIDELQKGLSLPVTINEIIPGGVVVALEYGANSFHGILFDTTSR